MQNQHQLGDSGWDIVGGFGGQMRQKKGNSTSADCHSSSRNIKIMNKTHTLRKNIKIQLKMDDGDKLKYTF